jgi:hypothetical protein
MSLQLPGTSVAVSTGARVCPMSVHASIVFKAMLVSHGPSKNFPHGEEKGTMGLLIILVCRECILEDLAHELRAISVIVRLRQHIYMPA